MIVLQNKQKARELKGFLGNACLFFGLLYGISLFQQDKPATHQLGGGKIAWWSSGKEKAGQWSYADLNHANEYERQTGSLDPSFKSWFQANFQAKPTNQCAPKAFAKTFVLADASTQNTTSPQSTVTVRANSQSQPGLQSEWLEQFLAAELAAQQGHFDIATEKMLALASTTQDIRLAEYAYSLAQKSGKKDLEDKSAKLWAEHAPAKSNGLKKRQKELQEQQIIAHGSYEQVVNLFTKKISQAGATAEHFVNLYQALQRFNDQQTSYRSIRTLLQGYENLADARMVVAKSALDAGDHQAAVLHSRAALNIKPDSYRVAYFHSQVLENTGQEEKLNAFLTQYKTTYPRALVIRIQYLRSLLRQEKHDDAFNEVGELLKQNPDEPDLLYIQGILAKKQGNLNLAKVSLEKSLRMGVVDHESATFHLADTHSQSGNWQEALALFQQITHPDYTLAAQIKQVEALTHTTGNQAAYDHLMNIRGQFDSNTHALILTEVALLKMMNQPDNAGVVLKQAIDLKNKSKDASKSSDLADYYYHLGLIDSEQNRSKQAEEYLKTALRLSPTHIDALNTVGYLLTGDKSRILEARGYLTTALELAPHNASVLDSMGKLLYAEGKLDESRAFFQEAFKYSKGDPKIGEHLQQVEALLKKQQSF